MTQRQAAALTAENLRTIYAYALSRVAHRADAEDLAGEIVVQILESAPRLRDDDAFFGYIWVIAANTVKKFLRRRGRMRTEELDEEAADSTDFTEELCRREELAALRRELAMLSRQYRECTVAYYMDGLSCAETAQKLGISTEMVKYYLFKTRKILKEGIAMEREFGEKSYKPAQFAFNTIFDGRDSAEYRRLFNRRLPGNILLSAYYTPMTVRELSIELGVASAYMEDETALLEKYGFLTPLSGGRLQTNLVIFTRAYTEEFRRQAEPICVQAMGEILSAARAKLGEIRALGFPGAELAENLLLWDLLFPMMREGGEFFERDCPAKQAREKLYDGATGTNYGLDYEEDEEDEYACPAFAGHADFGKGYAAAFADFGILPASCRCGGHSAFWDEVPRMLAGKRPAAAPIVTPAEEKRLHAILHPEEEAFGRLYGKLHRLASSVMRQHAPAWMGEQIERVTAGTLFFRTVGLIAASAVRSGALTIPADSTPAGVLIRRKE